MDNNKHLATMAAISAALLLVLLQSGVAEIKAEQQVYRPSAKYLECQQRIEMGEYGYGKHFAHVKEDLKTMADELNLASADYMSLGEFNGKRQAYHELLEMADKSSLNCLRMPYAIQAQLERYSLYEHSLVPYLKECMRFQEVYCNKVKASLDRQWTGPWVRLTGTNWRRIAKAGDRD